jgi:hypothetical protein
MVLKFPEFNKPFEVHTDASNFAIGRVLIQDARPIAYESKKLDGAKEGGQSMRRNSLLWCIA